MQYTKRIGIIIGPDQQFANLDWYTTQLVTAIGFIDNRIEIKKNFVYKKGYKLRALLVHITESKYDETNKRLQQL